MFSQVETIRNGIQEKAGLGRVVVELKGVGFSSHERVLFNKVNFSVRQGENVAIIGKSGVGKSTLLKIILGRETSENGAVTIPKGVRMSYVPQDLKDMEVDESLTINQLFRRARGIDEVERKKSNLEVAMGDPVNAGKINKLLGEYEQVCVAFEELGGYNVEAEMGTILSGLKIDEKTTGHINFETKLGDVSSGQRTKILIGQALFARADLLVMDEPTSHLDAASVSWLTQYLRRIGQASIITTNNMEFIDQCADKVVEITDFGRVLVFSGGYREYVDKRDRLLDAEKEAANAVKRRKEQLEETLAEFRARQVFQRSADMAKVGRALKTRVGQLDKKYQEMPGSRQVHRRERVRKLIFNEGERSGNDVVMIRSVIRKYEEFTALDLADLNLVLQRGQFLHVSGENGSGKSTLLRMIALADSNEFSPDAGSIELGAKVDIGYCASDHLRISQEGGILAEVKEASQSYNEGEAGAILLFWGFTKNTIRTKNIEQLSAGEKKQLALAKLMAKRPNLLILDEPTDFLKPEIVDRLIDALAGYSGTLVVVSHDQQFLNRLKVNLELHLPEGSVTNK